MLHETIDLQQRFPHLKDPTPMVTYIPDIPFDRVEKPITRPTVVVCPGGGYHFTSKREAEPIALAFNAAGYNAVVLYYSTMDQHPDTHFPEQLSQACAAIAYVRENAEAWHADPHQIYTCGFSAGGHLAGSAGVLWHLPAVSEKLGLASEALRPDGMILCYPVLTADPSFAHLGSIENVLGPDRKDDPAWRDQVCLEKQVREDTPPAFLWHTFEDTCVPVKNSLAFAEAMSEYQIPTEMHIFPHGWHGLSLSNEIVGGGPVECRQWMPLCIDWIERNK